MSFGGRRKGHAMLYVAICFTLPLPFSHVLSPCSLPFLFPHGENYLQRRVRIDLLDTVQNIDECVSFLFPPTVLANPLRALKRAFLSPKNNNVDDFNYKVLERVDEVECACLTVCNESKTHPPFFFAFQTFFTVRTLSKKTLNPQNMN